MAALTKRAKDMIDTFGYPSDNSERIASHLNEYVQERASELLDDCPCEARSVKRLLDTCFFASLLEEEGRPIVFSLAIAKKERVKGQSAVFEFQKAIELNTESLRKIALATDFEETLIGIEHSDTGWQIWGLINVGSPMLPNRTWTYPRFLVLSSGRRGHIDISLLGQSVYLFENGRQTLWSKLAQFNEYRLGEFLSYVIPETRPLARSVVAGVLYSILLHMQKARKGGALLIVPSSRAVVGLNVKYQFVSQSADWLTNMSRDEEHPDAAGRDEAVSKGDVLSFSDLLMKQKRSDAMKFIKKLTEVDGATVLTSQLELLGFGAMIDPAGSNDELPGLCRLQKNLLPGENMDIGELSGSRHRSAAHFCQMNSAGAVALVASQDGRLSMFAKSSWEHRVMVLSPFALSIT